MTEENEPSLGHVAARALALLKKHKTGLSMRQMREMLGETADDQEHFNRRVREIRKVYELIRTVEDGISVYTLGNRKEAPAPDSGQISEKLRAAILHVAHGRCQMCGKTIQDDGIKLQVDHKIPHSWGGPTEQDNLWAICEACNRGKRDFFATFDADEMSQVINIESVHERIAQFLKMHMPNPVPSYAIEFVANAKDQQLEWRKRLRELRYEPIGLIIEVSKKADEKGMQSYYALKNWRELPADHVRLIKEYENRGRNT